MSDDKQSHFFFLYGLALLIVVTFLLTVGMTLFGLTKVDSVLAGTLIGYLSAKCEQVVSFYYGSSAGSQRKDELLHQSTPVEHKTMPMGTKPIDSGE
jgi:hypothetical protein